MDKGTIFLQLLEKSSLTIVLFIIITKIQGFKYIFQKENYKLKDLFIISLIFTALAILGTYNGINVQGSLANTRIIAIVSGGVLFGPLVGITSGIISGFHRYITDIGGITAFPCFISSIFAGLLSGFFYKKISSKYKWIYGIACGVISESFSMCLIYLLSKPHNIAIGIIKKIYIPMIVGQISIGFLISIVDAIKKEKEEVAAMQSKLALDIANKTLPYFRSINEKSLEKICRIIRDKIKSDAVSITDRNEVLAYVGVGEEAFKSPHTEISNITRCSIRENKILNIQVKEEESSISEKVNLKTAMIIPLIDSKGVIGTLKIYYTKKYDMSHSKKSLAIGLSQIISTLMEISKIEKIEKEKKKAEIKALQRQINPHFLFNALNTITSFIRINPDKARNLIINLSTYMRYNLEVNDNLIDINKELEQVKAYVEIEKARFGDKLTVLYNIDDNIDAKIPSLIIQPLVENAIIHGIRKNGGCGTVVIGVKKEDGYTKVWVENDGITIDFDIIERVYSGKMPENKIGLYNVHLRLKLIYGQGLNIYRLEPGTRMEFYI
ncbi:MAG TPA: histidine kinase [Romboutsia timonensis]|uniref:Histidine kinase n=1 Tax=Romboutsia timonensis TaxID=1776391 RepID=A0A921MZB4_9FIRM|nr:LytS/YhcK type 5TM receptor domain-containing protein [uncultured Romboutsia sp.]HJG95797.1 histidine kinase [Romboutsia timonensis]